MESNEGNDGGAPDGQVGANEFSGSGSAQQQGSPNAERAFDFAGASVPSEQTQNLKDRARNALGTAGGKLVDVGSTVRERAGTAKDKLANALESGAERLRERAQSGAKFAAATADGSTAIQADGRIAEVSDKVAGGMEKSAEWLREADIDSIKEGIENQVKEHPARTLLIAAGIGYLLGRAFRSNQ
jgi:ElaB/YqjD/DUF883 family membrane-anchored ribosome-binding protein